MTPTLDPARDVLFGMLALQNGTINQVQLVTACQARSLDKARALADHLVGRAGVDDEQRAVVEAMVSLDLKKHGGAVEKSLAAIPAGRSTRESLARIRDPAIEASLFKVGSGLTENDSDTD